MAKKRAARKQSKVSAEAMFADDVRQDSVMLTDVDRSALATIGERHLLARSADALRFAVTAEAELCGRGKSKPPRARSKPKGVGRPMEEGGTDLRLFSFRTSTADRAAIEVIRTTHGIIKSAAIRLAIRREAARRRPSD